MFCSVLIVLPDWTFVSVRQKQFHAYEPVIVAYYPPIMHGSRVTGLLKEIKSY